MGDLREIIDRATVDRISLILAILLPPLFCALGAMIGTRHAKTNRGARIGFLLGMLGPANLLLWRVYNLITDRLGLDTVANVLVNLALFAGLGLAAGVVIRRSLQSRSSSIEAPPRQKP